MCCFGSIPMPFDAQVKAIKAQLKLSATRLSQMTQLFERDSGRGFDVEQRQSEVDQLKAQLESAKWNLDKTVVRAPADGYVTNIGPAQGRAGREPAAGAGDGVHRHVGYASSVSKSRRSMRDICGRASLSRSRSSSGRARSTRQGRKHSAGGRDRTGPGVGTGRDTERRCRFRLSFGSGWTMRSSRALAGRRHRRRRDFHRSRQGRPTSSEKCCCGNWRSSTTSIHSRWGDRSRAEDEKRRRSARVQELHHRAVCRDRARHRPDARLSQFSADRRRHGDGGQPVHREGRRIVGGPDRLAIETGAGQSRDTECAAADPVRGNRRQSAAGRAAGRHAEEQQPALQPVCRLRRRLVHRDGRPRWRGAGSPREAGSARTGRVPDGRDFEV